ncbi:MAG TPA: winged helix DNA-binding domain-containing protein [Micromonosporaceae bacterium]|nr:winged helix DNA-binding domain-containing protein [Micromonosporaceae bacterium]
MPAVMGRRALNRATLDRQLLLRRAALTPLGAITHLVGLQAQTPQTWYAGLWTRLVGFDPQVVADLLVERRVVRIALMRSTIHLVSAADALALRPLLASVGERGFRSNFGRHLAGLDLDDVAAAGRAVLDERPMIFSRLGRELGRRWPDRDPASLAQAVRAYVPLVQVPPRGVWGSSGAAAHAPLESWVGEELTGDYPVDDLVRRYLAAFGPASVRDAQVWSGLTRLREVLDRLRPELVVFRDDQGVELFDLPHASRPGPDVPAPARYLYDFDNLLLSHADRSRVVTEAYRAQNFDPNGTMPRLILVDGFTAGTWTADVTRAAAVLTVRPFGKLSTGDTDALASEGEGLLAFLAPSAAARDIRFQRPA